MQGYQPDWRALSVSHIGYALKGVRFFMLVQSYFYDHCSTLFVVAQFLQFNSSTLLVSPHLGTPG